MYLSMNFPKPSESGYTIYTKLNCNYCVKTKNLLSDNNITIYECDDYLENNKEEFLEFIKNLANKTHRTFPIIFKNSNYIGGYGDLLNLLSDIFSRND